MALSAHVQLLPKPQPPRVSERGPPEDLGPALAFSPPHQPTISEAGPLAIWTGPLQFWLAKFGGLSSPRGR